VTARSIGIAGSTDLGVVRRIAPIVERLGYRALWINDTPGGDSLAAIAAAAETTSTLGLAAGVVPVDRRPGAEIVPRLRDLPTGRVRLGVGSGQARHGLALLDREIAVLRASTDVPLLIGALGPRTRELAARIADGILFSWLTPPAAAAAMTRLREDAAGRPVEGVLYARTIAEPAARAALETETAQYASYPAYAANFARLGIDPLDTTLDLGRPGVVDALEREVDELVLRAVTATGSEAELVALVEAGAPVA